MLKTKPNVTTGATQMATLQFTLTLKNNLLVTIDRDDPDLIENVRDALDDRDDDEELAEAFADRAVVEDAFRAMVEADFDLITDSLTVDSFDINMKEE
jgi:hypothetical protein